MGKACCMIEKASLTYCWQYFKLCIVEYIVPILKGRHKLINTNIMMQIFAEFLEDIG